MLYNWIVATNDEANVNDNEDMDDAGNVDIADMRYAFNVDKGWRVDGWLKVDGSYGVGMENEEDWYLSLIHILRRMVPGFTTMATMS